MSLHKIRDTPDYFVTLFPALEGQKVLVSVVILVVYAGIAYLGNHTFATVNNIMVVLLLVAMALYIFVGLPNMNPGQLTLGAAFAPGIKITTLGAAIAILSSSLSGGAAVSQIADDVKNPRRNIPLALILSPTLVAVIYILMAVVTLGTMPGGELTTLSEVGSGFLSPALLTVFIVGGPICGVLTSMVSFVNCLGYMVLCIVPFFLKKKYPHACGHAGFKMPMWLMYGLSVFAFVVAAYLSYSALITLSATVWALMGGFVLLFVVYLFLRVSYLKGKGRDLMSDLKSPYEPWEAREAECRAQDEGA